MDKECHYQYRTGKLEREPSFRDKVRRRKRESHNKKGVKGKQLQNRPSFKAARLRSQISQPSIDTFFLKLGSRHWHENKRARRKRCTNQISKFLKKSSQWELVRQYDDRGDRGTRPSCERDCNFPYQSTTKTNRKKIGILPSMEMELRHIFKRVGVIFDPKVCPADIRPATVAKDFADLDNFIKRKAKLESAIAHRQQHLAYLRWNVEKREKMERKKRWNLLKCRRKLERCKERIIAADANLSKERLTNHILTKRENS